MTGQIDYGNLMHRALCGLIHTVLGDVARDGLPGDHHFFITFNTMHPEVEIADWLSDRFPDEMTMVLQNKFKDLEVSQDGFSVTLFFGGKPEPIYVPFDAIRTFADPSVEFGLVFKSQDGESTVEAPIDPGTLAPVPVEPSADAPRKDADIVSLDNFRK